MVGHTGHRVHVGPFDHRFVRIAGGFIVVAGEARSSTAKLSRLGNISPNWLRKSRIGSDVNH